MYKVEVGEALKTLINDVVKYQSHNALDGMIKCLREMTEFPSSIMTAMPRFDSDEVLLYVDNNITVYYISTTPNIIYPPHEHCMPAISALYKGTETHVFYDRDGENLIKREELTFKAPSVVDLTTDAIHAICTYDDEPNEGLHFYLGELEAQKRTLWDCSGKNPQQYIHEDYYALSKIYP